MALATQTLTCLRRELATKSHLHRLKRDGYIPAIVYGKGLNPITISIAGREVNKIFRESGMRGIFALNIAGESKPVMTIIRDWQRNPLTGNILHIDFMTINMSEKFTSNVAIHIVGEEAVVKKGGVVQLGAKEVEIECLPQDLPEYITCDISALEIGDKITIGELIVPQGVTIISEPDSVIALVLAPNKATAEEEELEEEETESGNEKESEE